MKLALVLIFAPGQVLVTDGLVHDSLDERWLPGCFLALQRVRKSDIPEY